MKRTLWILAALVATTSLSAAETKTRYLIATRRPAPAVSLRMVRDVDTAATARVRTFSNINAFAADLTPSEVAALKSSMDVRYIAPVVERTISSETVAPLALVPRAMAAPHSDTQTIPYGIDLIGSRSLWQYTRGGGIVNVVVADTGVDYNHPELKDRYVGGYNVYKKNDDPMDDHGHGTHVAGTIAAIDNNAGVVGVAPLVRLWGVKVLLGSGSGTDESIMAGMDWVISKKREMGGNWIVNLSLGAPSASDMERETFGRLVREGVLVVAAAGNRSRELLDIPASYDGVLAITAIDDKEKIAEFSSYGTGTAFAAPGVAVLSTLPVGTVEYVSVKPQGATRFEESWAVAGSKKGTVTGETVFCGFGRPEDFPSSVTGKIAIIKRSPQSENFRFKDKVLNAEKAGAIAVVMMPNDERSNMPEWTMLADVGDTPGTFPLAVSVNRVDGEKLIENAGKQTVSIEYGFDDYGSLSGTSMATPHVAGAAALIWSCAPTATSEQIAIAMKMTAFDLGARGYDTKYGYGRIDPLAAAKYVAPALFGVDPPAPVEPRKRGTR